MAPTPLGAWQIAAKQTGMSDPEYLTCLDQGAT